MATAAELLAKVETAIQAKLDGGAVEDYTIDGRSVKTMPLKDLFEIRAQLKQESADDTQGSSFLLGDLRGL